VLDYLFLDASFFRIHPGSPAEPVLAAWGITTDGKPVFVGLTPGSGESTDAWADFLRLLQDLRRSLLERPRQLRPRPTPARRNSDRPEPASA
jgi:transposase-like protein